MRVLVTGGCGFIGHNVVKKLAELGHSVLIVDNKTDYGTIPSDELQYIVAERLKKIPEGIRVRELDIESKHCELAFQEFLPELVIHLASFPRQKVVNKSPQVGARVMSEGLLNLLEQSVKYNVQRFVYVSSSMVYGDFTDNVQETAQCNPQGSYAIMKLAGEHLVKDYSRRGLLEHVIIRPSAVYGPLDVEDRVISKFMIGALRQDTLKVNGPLEKLDFTYVDDTVEGIVGASVSKHTANRTYNITRSQSISLLDAAELTLKIVGHGQLEICNRDLNFPSRGSLNIDAARRDFDYNPIVNLSDGLLKYHDWIHSSTYWQKKLSI